ncbi:MAG: DNA polymerase IV [Bacteroidota bacterium]
MNRSIIHLDLDCFFVACEILRDNRLRGKPIIVGGKSDRGVVASCSYEARHFGVRSAMPIRYALQRCPEALVIRGDMDMYSNYSHLVTTIIRELSPAFEKASIDEFYIDMTGMDTFYASYQWAQELEQAIYRESGLDISFGLSINKTVAKMATNEGKPRAQLEVPLPEVRPFLNPLSVSKIPQIGKQTFRILSRSGIRRIRTLAEMPVAFMVNLLGKNGRTIWERANGIDERPIVPYNEKKSISAERTFTQDTIDIIYLRAQLLKLTEGLAYELRQSGRLASVVSVKLRYTNFDTHSKQRRIPYTANDQQLIRVVHELFGQLYERRMLIRLVGVKLSGLVQGYVQMDLFEDTGEQTALNNALDEVRRKFGKSAIQRAVNLPSPNEQKTNP